ncbi:hypothetical protein BKA70DRAFT_1569126 [Coprinopsis sp. MPI-PUGE-AT-0042]|nr:hypothetical protein BKA70DRAFT_1569126 [Coprinopsis sp. MPI-PUGE-AT-0042]
MNTPDILVEVHAVSASSATANPGEATDGTSWPDDLSPTVETMTLEGLDIGGSEFSWSSVASGRSTPIPDVSAASLESVPAEEVTVVEERGASTGTPTKHVSGSEPSIQKHPLYFWECITMKVQGVAFQLPRYRFVEASEAFTGMVTKSEEDGPIELDVALGDFESFLKAFLPRASAMYDDKPTLTKDEWISVLKLSTLWLFDDPRKLAINHLSGIKMDAIDRICLAKEHRVYDWLLQGYEQVIERLLVSDDPDGEPMTLTTQEGTRIGMDVALELSGVAIRRLRGAERKATLKSLESDVLGVFQQEFNCIQKERARSMTRAERFEEATKKVKEEEEAKKGLAEEAKKEAKWKEMEDEMAQRSLEVEAKQKRDLRETELKELEDVRLKELKEIRLKELEEIRLKELEETRLRELEEIRLKELEEVRLRELEESRLKAIEEARLKELEVLEETRLRELEEIRLKELEETRLKELEEARLKAIEEARRECQRVAHEEAAKKQEEEAAAAARKREEEEAAAAEAARIAAEQEATRVAAEQEAARLASEQEAEAKRLAEAAQRKADEEAAAEAARVAAAQEAARVAAEQEAARLASEQEAEAKRLEEVAARKRDEEEAARWAAEQEAERISREEAARIAAEQEAESKRLADIEAKRLVDEAEAKRISEEAEVKRLADEIEAKRLADDEAKRKEQAKQEEAKSATKAVPELAKEGEDGEDKLIKAQKKNKKKKGKKSTAKVDDKESFQDVATPVTKPIELVDTGPSAEIKTIIETPPTLVAQPLAQTTQSSKLIDLGAPADVEPHAQTPVVAAPSPMLTSLFDEPESTPRGKKPARYNNFADSDLSGAYQSGQSGPPTPTPEQQEFKRISAPDAPPKPANGSWNPYQQPQLPGAVPTSNGQWHGNNPVNNWPLAPPSTQAGRSAPTPRASRVSLQERIAGTSSKVSKTLGHKSSNSGQKKEKEGSWGWF